MSHRFKMLENSNDYLIVILSKNQIFFELNVLFSLLNKGALQIIYLFSMNGIGVNILNHLHPDNNHVSSTAL
jgi:hypothetical protein